MSSLKELQRSCRSRASGARMSMKTLAREVQRFVDDPPPSHLYIGWLSPEDWLVGVGYADLTQGTKATKNWYHAACNAAQERHSRRRKK